MRCDFYGCVNEPTEVIVYGCLNLHIFDAKTCKQHIATWKIAIPANYCSQCYLIYSDWIAGKL